MSGENSLPLTVFLRHYAIAFFERFPVGKLRFGSWEHGARTAWSLFLPLPCPAGAALRERAWGSEPCLCSHLKRLPSRCQWQGQNVRKLGC